MVPPPLSPLSLSLQFLCPFTSLISPLFLDWTYLVYNTQLFATVNASENYISHTIFLSKPNILPAEQTPHTFGTFTASSIWVATCNNSVVHFNLTPFTTPDLKIHL
ncbi:hypothetical protein BDV35DRAFT_188178 [Aspergillus flavus]|uniref:Uncharacterized protein n=1 Tax=Aspergillus flavus TaxID=5059 RepID=A0A5N6H0B0_ASPFL|nr:hypothetical protein BDV35DRAFT_188178 [Aspergillus flavus]